MLDKKIYIAGMNQLSLSIDKFDMDKFKLDGWYPAFEDYTVNEFKLMIKLFIKNSDYPPSMPRNIIKIYEEHIGEKVESSLNLKTPDEAWAIVIQGIRAYGLSYSHDKFYQHLENNGGVLLKELAKRYIRELEQLKVGDTFVMSAFKKSYTVEIEHEKKNKVKQKMLSEEELDRKCKLMIEQKEDVGDVDPNELQKLLNTFKEEKQ